MVIWTRSKQKQLDKEDKEKIKRAELAVNQAISIGEAKRRYFEFLISYRLHTLHCDTHQILNGERGCTVGCSNWSCDQIERYGQSICSYENTEFNDLIIFEIN